MKKVSFIAGGDATARKLDPRSGEDDAGADVDPAERAEQLRQAREAYANETRQRNEDAARRIAAQLAAAAAAPPDDGPGTPEPEQTGIDEFLAGFDENQLLSEIDNQKTKHKAINETAAYYKIAVAIKDIFDEAQLDRTQQHQILSRIFRVFTAPQISLPEEAPEQYADRADRSEKPVEFIRRVYQPWLGAGLTQAHIHHLDKKLYMALHNWLRHNELPADLDLPTKTEAVTREIQDISNSPDFKDARRVVSVLGSRATRAKKATP